MKESVYQAHVIGELRRMFPNCVILKNDASYQQGIPDLLVLWGPKWATLESKVTLRSRRQPNQDYFVELLNSMSFAAFICPENEEEVFNALQQAFES